MKIAARLVAIGSFISAGVQLSKWIIATQSVPARWVLIPFVVIMLTNTLGYIFENLSISERARKIAEMNAHISNEGGTDAP